MGIALSPYEFAKNFRVNVRYQELIFENVKYDLFSEAHASKTRVVITLRPPPKNQHCFCSFKWRNEGSKNLTIRFKKRIKLKTMICFCSGLMDAFEYKNKAKPANNNNIIIKCNIKYHYQICKRIREVI